MEAKMAEKSSPAALTKKTRHLATRTDGRFHSNAPKAYVRPET
jgi:hypothetical protein